MSVEEKIYRYDLVGGLQVAQGITVVQIVENAVAASRSPDRTFAIYQKTTGIATDRPALHKELRAHKPLMALWNGASLPLLSDPFNQICGAIAIDTTTHSLMYSPGATPLHDMRDGYRWSYGTLNNYYAIQDFLETVKEFLEGDYKLYGSDFRLVDTPPGVSITGLTEIDPTGFIPYPTK